MKSVVIGALRRDFRLALDGRMMAGVLGVIRVRIQKGLVPRRRGDPANVMWLARKGDATWEKI